MNRFLFAIAAVLALALIPAAHAELRIQSVSSSLYGFDGPTKINYHGSGFSGTYYHANDRVFFGANSRNGPSGSISLRRPTYVQNHYFDEPKYNYRTVEHGDWQLGQAHYRSGNTNIGVSQLYGQYSLRGNINGYTGASGTPHHGYNSFSRSNNIRSYSYPYTYSGFGYTTTPSAYTSRGSAYY